MECPLLRLLISSRLINKHGYHWNLVGSIYGMFFMKIAHFILIGQQTWRPHAILVSDWFISYKCSPLKLHSHMNRNLVRSIYMYGRFCIKISSKQNERWATQAQPTEPLVFIPTLTLLIIGVIQWESTSRFVSVWLCCLIKTINSVNYIV